MKRLLLILSILVTGAAAQVTNPGVTVTGAVTVGHCASFAAGTQIQDAGSTCGGSGGTPGGSNTQLQYNNSGAFGGISGWTTNGTTQVNAGATSVFDLHLMSSAADFLLPGALSTGIVTVTTTTGAVNSIPAPAGTVVGTSDSQALTNKDLTGAGNIFPTFNQNTTGSAAQFVGVNAQVGTSYAMQASDSGKLVTMNNGASIAVSLSQATAGGFGAGYWFLLQNLGAGQTTITPTTSTIAGQASLLLQGAPSNSTGQLVFVWSDGANYQAAYLPTTLATNGAVQVANGGTGIVSGTSGGIPCFTGTTAISSSGVQAANQIMVGGGAGVCPTTSGIRTASNAISGTANSSNIVYTAGLNSASANAALGTATLAGPSEQGTGGSASVGGHALVTGGSNAATSTSSRAGSVEVSAGQSTGATNTGLQGLVNILGSYAKGTTVTQWNLQCAGSTAFLTQDCGASPGNMIGVAQTVGSIAVLSTIDGQTPVNASAAVTIGHTVCAGTTAGKVTDSGGTALCVTGDTVGVVLATAGNYIFADGTTFTATTTLPVIQLRPSF